MEIIAFGSKNLENILIREPHRAEYLPFGAVLLDRAGKIVRYNKAAGLGTSRVPEELVGRILFKEVTTCAKGKRIHREFRKYQRTEQIDLMFEFTLGTRGC